MTVEAWLHYSTSPWTRTYEQGSDSDQERPRYEAYYSQHSSRGLDVRRTDGRGGDHGGDEQEEDGGGAHGCPGASDSYDLVECGGVGGGRSYAADGARPRLLIAIQRTGQTLYWLLGFRATRSSQSLGHGSQTAPRKVVYRSRLRESGN